MKADLPKREPATLKLWKDMDIYARITDVRKGSGRKFILHDGPPYSNGDIHMGHALNKILKDIVVKFNTMVGCDVPFIPGWDCHGLPVEHQLMKNLKIEKGDIPQSDFRKKAKAYALKYVDVQRSQFERLGIFGDWRNPYLTLNPQYEGAIVRSFAMLIERGYIYKDLKPVNWCYRCETALAEAEVEYDIHTSPSVYVKFKVSDLERFKSIFPDKDEIKKIDRDIHVLIWTTTPWTLVSNVAIALSPNMRYVLVDMKGDMLIMAEELLGAVSEKLGVGKPETLVSFFGPSLDGLTCQHPFINRTSRIVLADYVSHE